MGDLVGLLEARAKAGTGEAIRALLGLHARAARILRDGQEDEIPIDEVVVGDEILIRPGEKIPVDAAVLAGQSAVDESVVYRLPAGAGGQDRRGHDAGADHPHGAAGTGVQGSDPAAGRCNVCVLRAGRHRDRDCHLRGLVRGRPGPRIDAGLVSAVAVLIIACPCALGSGDPARAAVAITRQVGVPASACRGTARAQGR
ncbi:hypothetical protein BST47_26430 [Mycolicibacterium tusciae]|uniref:P-type ATPase A domain-containing protein n=1 Tax=Mycolicibacterium tusciae TaxID=75922 RepID=A0A1X0JFG9_9MYCO|nr:hypothetical protein BST47_26430 [Mycolicibacterium tusciae]